MSGRVEDADEKLMCPRKLREYYAIPEWFCWFDLERSNQDRAEVGQAESENLMCRSGSYGDGAVPCKDVRWRPT